MSLRAFTTRDLDPQAVPQPQERDAARNLHWLLLEAMNSYLSAPTDENPAQEIANSPDAFEERDAGLTSMLEESLAMFCSEKVMDFWEDTLTLFDRLRQVPEKLREVRARKLVEERTRLDCQRALCAAGDGLSSRHSLSFAAQFRQSDQQPQTHLPEASHGPGNQSPAQKSTMQSLLCASNILNPSCASQNLEDSQPGHSGMGQTRGDQLISMLKVNSLQKTVSSNLGMRAKAMKQETTKALVYLKAVQANSKGPAGSLPNNRRVLNPAGVTKVVKRTTTIGDKQRNAGAPSTENRSTHLGDASHSQYVYHITNFSDNEEEIELRSPQKNLPEALQPWGNLHKTSQNKQQTIRLGSEGKENYSSLKKAHHKPELLIHQDPAGPCRVFQNNFNLLNKAVTPQKAEAKCSQGKESLSKQSVGKTTKIESVYENKMRKLSFWADQDIVAYGTPIKEETSSTMHTADFLQSFRLASQQ